MAVEYDPALINRVFEVTEPVEVKAEKIKRYCAALGETNPIYTDEEAAKTGPYGGIVAPPSFAVTFRNGRHFFENVPRFGRRGFDAGKDVRVRLADPAGRPDNADLAREGNFREDGTDGDDGVRGDPIDAEKSEGRSAGAYRPSLHEPHVSKFDEINIGDTLGPLELFVSKDQCRAYAKLMGMGEIAGRFTDDEAAKKEGLPGMILPGNMSLGLLSKLVTDWIGSSNAWLKQMSTTYRVPVQPDHAITIHGFITNKNPEEHTAEIDVWMENEEAERLVTGTATVEFRK